jgi:hypothetical protein
MSKGPLVCCLALLVVTSLTRGQPTAAPPAPAPSLAQPELAPATPPGPNNVRIVYPLDTAPPAAIPVSPFAHMGAAPAPWFVTAEAEFILGVTQSQRASRIANLAGPVTIGVPLIQGDPDRTGPPLTLGRFTIGVWAADEDPLLDPSIHLAAWGGEVRGLVMAERTVGFAGQAVVPGLGQSDLIGHGSFNLWGIEANARHNVCNDTPGQMVRLDLVGGFRYLNSDSNLSASRQTVFAANVANFPAFAALAGSTVLQRAAYETENDFYGPQVGVAFQFFFARSAVFGGDAKIALGAVHERLNITGQLLGAGAIPALATTPFPADSGSYSRTSFSYVPELNLYLGLRVLDNLTVRAGYTALYWSAVGRASDQIDGRAVGSAARVEVIREKGLFIHGLDLGLQVSF